jgi:hypothetical protein
VEYGQLMSTRNIQYPTCLTPELPVLPFDYF